MQSGWTVCEPISLIVKLVTSFLGCRSTTQPREVVLAPNLHTAHTVLPLSLRYTDILDDITTEGNSLGQRKQLWLCTYLGSKMLLHELFSHCQRQLEHKIYCHFSLHILWWCILPRASLRALLFDCLYSMAFWQQNMQCIGLGKRSRSNHWLLSSWCTANALQLFQTVLKELHWLFEDHKYL